MWLYKNPKITLLASLAVQLKKPNSNSHNFPIEDEIKQQAALIDLSLQRLQTSWTMKHIRV